MKTALLIFAALIIAFLIILEASIYKVYNNERNRRIQAESLVQEYKIGNSVLLNKVSNLEKENKELKDMLNQKPTRNDVITYITKLWGANAKEALVVADCESDFDQSKIGINKTSFDSGVFQINSVHIKRFGTDYLKSWTANIDTAYKIWQEQGWNPWVCKPKVA